MIIVYCLFSCFRINKTVPWMYTMYVVTNIYVNYIYILIMQKGQEKIIEMTIRLMSFPSASLKGKFGGRFIMIAFIYLISKKSCELVRAQTYVIINGEYDHVNETFKSIFSLKINVSKAYWQSRLSLCREYLFNKIPYPLD